MKLRPGITCNLLSMEDCISKTNGQNKSSDKEKKKRRKKNTDVDGRQILMTAVVFPVTWARKSETEHSLSTVLLLPHYC